jgi:PAS domain S-box-containing protein
VLKNENDTYRIRKAELPETYAPLDPVLDVLQAGYLLTATDGSIINANRFVCQLLDTPLPELIGSYLSDYLPGGMRIYLEMQVYPLLYMQGKVEEIAIDLRRKDNSAVAVLMGAVKTTQPQTGKVSIQYTFFDISHRKKYERELLAAHQLQQQLIDELTVVNQNYIELALQLESQKETYKKQAQIYGRISEVGRVGGWEFDPGRGSVHYSSVTRQILQLDEASTPDVRQALAFFKAGSSRAAIRRAFRAALAHGTSFDGEAELCTPDGQQAWVRVQICVEQHQSRTVRLYGTLQDIDQSKQMILALQQSNRRIARDAAFYKYMVENHSFFILKTDLEGRFTFVNPFFCQILGIGPEEYLGKAAVECLEGSDRSSYQQTLEKCRTEPSRVHWVILRQQTPDGLRINQWEMQLLRDEEGKATEFLCIGHPITDLIEKQNQLSEQVVTISEQNRRLQNFTHIISHNIRSHVANLSGLLAMGESEPDQKHMLMQLIKNTVGSLDQTIEHLNEIVSIQSNVQLPYVSLPVRETLEALLPAISKLLERSEAILAIDIAEHTRLCTNLAYFESIFLNLLTNAIKYASPARRLRITIGFRETDGFSVIYVQDNGLGIDLSRYRDKLFGLYKTFHGNEDAKGLGLFLTKTQVEALKGRIEVESSPDQGSTFSVYFPQSVAATDDPV